MDMKHIKVNLPTSREEEMSGNGEGVWVIVTTATRLAHDQDLTDGNWYGQIDNDSIYYPFIKAETRFISHYVEPSDPWSSTTSC